MLIITPYLVRLFIVPELRKGFKIKHNAFCTISPIWSHLTYVAQKQIFDPHATPGVKIPEQNRNKPTKQNKILVIHDLKKIHFI
mgnify:CR=1 FL=1